MEVFDFGIHIYWRKKRLTSGVGLNAGINTLGLWTDSSKSRLDILEERESYIKIKVHFVEISVTQIWKIHTAQKDRLCWSIAVENSEWIHINELVFLTMLNPSYTTWFHGYQQGKFSRFEKEWRDFYLGKSGNTLTGVRFSREEDSLPALAFESDGRDCSVSVENSSVQENSRLIGYRFVYDTENGDFSPGLRHICNINIHIFEKDLELDADIECSRQRELGLSSKQQKEQPASAGKLKLLLANLPWRRKGKWGVRAGSRWPHIKDQSEDQYMPFPFFLAYSASLLRENNIDADIIDAIAQKCSEDDFIEIISGKKIDYLIAETSIPSFFDDMNILSRIASFGIKIILCGPNSHIYESDFMQKYSFVDFVLKGEYEFTLLELARALESQANLSSVNGIVYREDDKIIHTPERALCDIDDLPWPHRETLPMEKYWDLPGDIPYPSVQMLASRGCPFNCSFCLWPQVMYKPGTYRVRDIKDVIDEMEFLVKEKGFRSVYFDDDTFNIGRERMFNFSRELINRGLSHIPWAIMARADLMDRDLLVEMKKSGLSAIKYGVESFHQGLVQNCQKDLDIKKAQAIIRLTKELGIKVHLTFAFGFPGETRQTINMTIDSLLCLNPDSVQFSIATPFPGTRFFRELDTKGGILTYDWSKYDGHSNCVFKSPDIMPEELVKAKENAYRLWYVYKKNQNGVRGYIKKAYRLIKRDGVRASLHRVFHKISLRQNKHDNAEY